MRSLHSKCQVSRVDYTVPDTHSSRPTVDLAESCYEVNDIFMVRGICLFAHVQEQFCMFKLDCFCDLVFEWYDVM